MFQIKKYARFSVPPLCSELIDVLHQVYSRERKLWERLMQENILPLLGVARGFDTPPDCDALVCPWMENGTLSKYIDRYPTIELRQKLKLVCCGRIAIAKSMFQSSYSSATLPPAFVTVRAMDLSFAPF